MHSVYIVFHDNGDSSIQAKNEAISWLDENGFSNPHSFYGHGKADWFVVGGRWSGMFTELSDEYQRFHERAKNFIKENYPELLADTFSDEGLGIRGVSFGNKETSKKQKKAKEKIKEMWDKEGNKTSCPLLRDSLGRIGIDNAPKEDIDDAQKLDKDIFEKLKKEYGDIEVVVVTDAFGGEERLMKDIDYEEIKDKWAVVIDYHF